MHLRDVPVGRTIMVQCTERVARVIQHGRGSTLVELADERFGANTTFSRDRQYWCPVTQVEMLADLECE